MKLYTPLLVKCGCKGPETLNFLFFNGNEYLFATNVNACGFQPDFSNFPIE
jgi:hypothetical protein